MSNSANKRNFFRLDLTQPLCADLKIIPLEELDVESKIIRVAISDISAGGLRFVSPVSLPDDAQTLLEFKFLMMGKEVKLLGQIVRVHDAGNFEYSVSLTIEDSDQSSLIQLINQLTVSLRKNKPVSSCSFCTAEEIEQIFAKE